MDNCEFLEAEADEVIFIKNLIGGGHGIISGVLLYFKDFPL